jgi:hypothetical protein
MNATQQPDTRTSNGDQLPKQEVKRPEVRPDVSFWGDIREAAKKSWVITALHLLGLGGLFSLPIGVIAALSILACRLMKAEGIDPAVRVVAVLAIALMLTILGMATLFMGMKIHAKTNEDYTD